MGTKVQCKSYLPGYYPMNDLNDNSNICNWPPFYGDKSVCGPYNNGFFLTPTPEMYLGGEKDAVKLTMLEHEAIFKNQVYELHRLYRIQRDMMDEIKRKEFNESQIQGDGYLSENLLPSQIASENVQKCHFRSSNVAYSSSNKQSISGAEEIHSSLSPMKGNNWQVGPFPSPNGSIVKEFERPTKSRKMLDLQLPADEFIDSDEDEQTHNKKVLEMSDYLPNKNQTIESEKNNDKAGCSILWKSNGFGDLNVPIQLQETNVSRHDDITCHTSFHGETRNSNLSSKPLSQPLDLSREISLNSSYGSNNAIQNNHDAEKSRNGRMFSNVLEAGNSKDNDKSKLPLSSKPIPGFLNAKAERKDGPKKSPHKSFHKHLGGFTTSHLTNPYQVSPHFNLNKSWPRSVSTWEKQSCQTVMSVQRPPGFHFDSSVSTLHKSSNLMAQGNGYLHGSSSRLKDGTACYSSTSYDYPKFISNNNRASEKIHEAPNYFDMNSPIGINLNVVCSNSSSDGATHHSAFTIKDGKAQNENHRSLIPWLKAMPSSMNEAENSSRLVNNGEISFAQSSVRHDKMENGECPKKVFSHLMKFSSCSNDFVEKSLESGSKKILGFTIFDESLISKNDSFSLTSPSARNPHPPSESEREDGRKIRALDINLPCDPSVLDTETLKNSTVSSLKHQIDLNICLSDHEEVFDIDLEAPAVPESIENVIVEEVENSGDELVKMAAEAIVSISSGKNLNKEEDDSLRGSLPWFVDLVLNNESTREWIDHFEAMTLSLKEITEEEYMPKLPFPNDVKFEESVNFSQTRLRRGQSRRGRQRRDFQRDILPGLTTLSRHEVTEDLQTFSGLMRATGHSYSGLTRRNSGRNNGCGRGRRKAVVTPSPLQNTRVACNMEVGLDDRSLTGWGKTTRRPRRQRIPAGNLNVVPLS